MHAAYLTGIQFHGALPLMQCDAMNAWASFETCHAIGPVIAHRDGHAQAN